MAKDGWNHHAAYFLDFDGKYYRCKISVSMGADGSVVYNIGDMQERSFPTAQKALNGSSANSGALGRKASSEQSVTDNGKEVKTSREPETLNELRRQNELKLAQATAEDAANENERGHPWLSPMKARENPPLVIELQPSKKV